MALSPPLPPHFCGVPTPVWLHSGHMHPAGTSTDHKHHLFPAQTHNLHPVISCLISAAQAAEMVYLAMDEEAGLAAM